MALEDVVEQIVKDQPTEVAGTQAPPVEGSPGAVAPPEYADAIKAFKDSGLKPDEAREAARQLAHFRTEQGQRDYQQALYQQAQEMMAREINSAEGLAKWDSLAARQRQALGLQAANNNDEALTPEEREIRSLKAEVGQLKAGFAQVRGHAQAAAEATGNLQVDTIRSNVFRDWRAEQHDIPQEVLSKIAKRFVKDATSSQGVLRDAPSVRQYLNDGLSDYREAHGAFAKVPQPKHVPTRSDIGNPNADKYKGITDPAKRLEKMIDDATNDIDTPMR